MKQKLEQKVEPILKVDGRISLRLENPLAERFAKVVTASRRTKTSLVEEALEKALPEFERQHNIKNQLKSAA